MRRREFITFIGGATASSFASWPLAALAQPDKSQRRIGVLIPYPESDADSQAEVAAFRETLQQLGWAAGRNLRIDYRWAGGDAERIRTFAKELVALNPDAILARTTPATTALVQETRTIPVVFVNVSDPVGAGFASSIAPPGGNATGFTNVQESLGSKWVELLKDINPHITRIATLFDPATSPGRGSFYGRLVQDAARSIAVEITATPIHDVAEIEQAVKEFARSPNGGLLVQPDVTTTAHRALIIALAARHRLPAVYPFQFFVTEGGLASYGIDTIDLYRRAAVYVDRILRGEKPGDLAVQAPVKFELAINLKAAHAIGLDVPPLVLARADAVIE